MILECVFIGVSYDSKPFHPDRLDEVVAFDIKTSYQPK